MVRTRFYFWLTPLESILNRKPLLSLRKEKKEKLKQQKGSEDAYFLVLRQRSESIALPATNAQGHPGVGLEIPGSAGLNKPCAGVSCRHTSLPLTPSVHPWGAVGFGLTAFFTPINRKEMQNIFLVKSFVAPMVGRVLLGFCDWQQAALSQPRVICGLVPLPP